MLNAVTLSDLRSRSFVRLLLIFLVAQPAAMTAVAQPVRLELRPRVGDTLVLRIEQQTQLLNNVMRGPRDTIAAYQTTMLMFARAIIERADPSGARVLTITDSVRVTSSGQVALQSSQSLASGSRLEGKRVWMKLLPDGASELINGDSGISSVVRALIAEMPSTLPREAVDTGATWSTRANIPLETGGFQTLVTNFRLDSLTKDRQLAYISMRGEIMSPSEARLSKELMEATGDLSGGMTIDRRRGWIIDSIAIINLKSMVRKPIESGGAPVRFDIRITQKMHTISR